MRAVLLAVSSGVVLADASNLRGRDPWKLFTEFKTKYNMVFESQEEDAKRFEIFKTNLEKADALNLKEPTVTFGVSKFAHLTAAEFKERHTGFKPAKNRKRFPMKKVKNVKTGSIDWRDIGGVSPVKDQGQCGSCWAFSATEAVETGYWKATGDLKILAPQQVVSCDRSDMACDGGDTFSAYEYIQEAGGIEEESDYPYTSGDTERRGRCSVDPSEFAVKIDGVNTISQGPGGEEDMYSAIMDSPMSICVDAESWQMYMGGVVTSATCGTELDHCVFLVGVKEGEYWIVKNQWNSDWGEDGYIRVKTGENACGVAMEATTVTASAEAAKKAVKDTPSSKDLVAIIQGLSEGFGLTLEEECISASEDGLEKLSKAIELMEKKTTIDMMEAMRLVAEAFEKDWPEAAKACSSTKDEFNKILAALEILEHPKKFAYHVGHDLMINGVDIYKNVNDSIGHWKATEYHDFGFSLGTAMSELIVGTTEEDVYV